MNLGNAGGGFDAAGAVNAAANLISVFSTPPQINIKQPSSQSNAAYYLQKSQQPKEKDYTTVYVVAGTVLLLGVGTLIFLKK